MKYVRVPPLWIGWWNIMKFHDMSWQILQCSSFSVHGRISAPQGGDLGGNWDQYKSSEIFIYRGGSYLRNHLGYINGSPIENYRISWGFEWKQFPYCYSITNNYTCQNNDILPIGPYGISGPRFSAPCNIQPVGTLIHHDEQHDFVTKNLQISP